MPLSCVWGLLEGRVMPLSIWAHSGAEIGAQPRPGLGSELSASQECYTEARKASGARRRALWTSTSWGWRTWVGSHLQPPDCDLSRATPRCSPDLTQSLPNSAGRPFPGPTPRRPPDATGPTQTEAIPPWLGSQGLQQDLQGEQRAKVTCWATCSTTRLPSLLTQFVQT